MPAARRAGMVLAVLLLLLPLGGTAATDASVRRVLEVPLMRQADPRWAQLPLGGDGPPIGDEGCALTSFAMVASFWGEPVTPDRVNETLEEYAYPLEWVAGWSRYGLHVVRKDSVRFRDSRLHDPVYVRHVIEDCILAGYPVIVGIVNERDGAPHFVVAYGVEPGEDGTVRILLRDPSGRSAYETLDDVPPYWSVMRLVVYRK